jgi:hypothetical protein
MSELRKMPEMSDQDAIRHIFEREGFSDEFLESFIRSGVLKRVCDGRVVGNLASGYYGKNGRPRKFKPQDINFEGHSPYCNEWYRQVIGRGTIMARNTFLALRKELQASSPLT